MKIVNYVLTNSERETHIYITKNADGKEIAEIETTESKVYNRLIRRGWKLTDEIRNKNGSLIQANFEAPASLVSFRSVKL